MGGVCTGRSPRPAPRSKFFRPRPVCRTSSSPPTPPSSLTAKSCWRAFATASGSAKSRCSGSLRGAEDVWASQRRPRHAGRRHAAKARAIAFLIPGAACSGWAAAFAPTPPRAMFCNGISESVPLLPLADPSFYHLDTAFCALPCGGVIYYPAAFTPPALARDPPPVAPLDRIVLTRPTPCTLPPMPYALGGRSCCLAQRGALAPDHRASAAIPSSKRRCNIFHAAADRPAA